MKGGVEDVQPVDGLVVKICRCYECWIWEMVIGGGDCVLVFEFFD